MNSPLVSILNLLCLLVKREDGQDLVEYALVVALIALATILGLRELGGTASLIYSAISSVIQGAT